MEVERPRRFVAKRDPECANFLAEARQAKNEEQLQAQGKILAAAMKSSLEEHVAEICGQGFTPQSVGTPPGAVPGGPPTPSPFPPSPPGAVPATVPSGLWAVAKAWLKSLAGAAVIPEDLSKQSITTFLADCISKDSEAKER
eukprot:992755-Pyramimonas_sp.AAC.1